MVIQEIFKKAVHLTSLNEKGVVAVLAHNFPQRGMGDRPCQLLLLCEGVQAIALNPDN